MEKKKPHWGVSNDGNHWFRDRKSICHYFIQNFKEVFKSSNPQLDAEINDLVHASITIEMNKRLCQVLNAQEVRKFIWEMSSLKASGPDGMPASFYKNYWDIVDEDVVKTIQEFFITTKFVKSPNRTFIILFLKHNDAKGFKDYCPISLCNTTYKTISKLLAYRLKGVLGDVISHFQTAFVLGRWIVDN